MNCIICNKEIKESEYTNEILCSSECFHVNYWNEMVDRKYELNIVRIDGEQYYIENENSNSIRGFGGRKHTIRFFDGREVISTNLWCNGTIPKSHRKLLPDNAEFVVEKVKDILDYDLF